MFPFHSVANHCDQVDKYLKPSGEKKHEQGLNKIDNVALFQAVCKCPIYYCTFAAGKHFWAHSLALKWKLILAEWDCYPYFQFLLSAYQCRGKQQPNRANGGRNATSWMAMKGGHVSAAMQSTCLTTESRSSNVGNSGMVESPSFRAPLLLRTVWSAKALDFRHQSPYFCAN